MNIKDTIENNNTNDSLMDVKDTKKNNSINEALIEKLKNEKNQFIPARTSTLPKGVVEDILKDIQKTYELNDRDEAIAVLAILFQQGVPPEVAMAT